MAFWLQATARLFERLTWLNEARASKNSLPTEQVGISFDEPRPTLSLNVL